MIEIKSGDTVKLPDGTIVKVLGYYNQGKHRVFKLEGDTTATDIHKAEGTEVISTPPEISFVKKRMVPNPTEEESQVISRNPEDFQRPSRRED